MLQTCVERVLIYGIKENAAMTLIHVVTVADEFGFLFFFLMGEKISKGKVREKRGQL